MQINTVVVRALMALRRLDEPTLANIANISPDMLSGWLHKDGDDSVPFHTQLEILRVLGIKGDLPRDDSVHYWFVHQDLFGRADKMYWALEVITETFGKAEVVYFAEEADPLVRTSAKMHFGLQFASFKAILEVTSHPLRNIAFDPANFSNLSWTEGNPAVLMDKVQFAQLAPGKMTPPVFESKMNLGREQLAWERLNLLARESNVNAETLELLLRGAKQGLTPQLGAAAAAEAASEVVTGGPATPSMAPAEPPAQPATVPAEPVTVAAATTSADAAKPSTSAFVPRPRRKDVPARGPRNLRAVPTTKDAA